MAVDSAKEIIDTVLKDPSLLAKPGALVTKIVKIITDNALKAFGDTTALGDLKQLAQDIVNNLKAAKACFVINIPGQPRRSSMSAISATSSPPLGFRPARSAEYR
ncbi:hypothetical protein JCM18916_1808 [Cutibacterium acnes JCM 18916]|nr:hypothetical protein JCM18916_1808 [Cutibacterium acnes JCM 18916]